MATPPQKANYEWDLWVLKYLFMAGGARGGVNTCFLATASPIFIQKQPPRQDRANDNEKLTKLKNEDGAQPNTSIVRIGTRSSGDLAGVPRQCLAGFTVRSMTMLPTISSTLECWHGGTERRAMCKHFKQDQGQRTNQQALCDVFSFGLNIICAAPPHERVNTTARGRCSRATQQTDKTLTNVLQEESLMYQTT